ncbi:hypothetical protein ACDF64_03890 [Agromyces sp. MMS24-JH15]|uniref:hypothetical protein n=1 Tax=Agromyces sp. MMS24-JH15 TaxID=3243765 RepID=UPI0037487C91
MSDLPQASPAPQPVPGRPEWAPAPPRPPLDPRSRTGALVGGGLGLTLVTWGLGAVAFGAVVGFVALAFGLIAHHAREWGRAGMRDLERFADAVPWWVVLAVVVIAVVFGIAAIIGGVIAEHAVLTRFGVHRPNAVLWSGLGIGLLANGFAGGVVSLVFSAVPQIDFSDGGMMMPGRFGLTASSGFVAFAVMVAVGALSAWWMAHAFRPTADELAAAAQPVPAAAPPAA